MAKEGARDDSFQSILCDTYKGAVETCKAIISYVGSFILRAKGGERWPDVVTPPQGWDEKDQRWKRAQPILARPHVLRRSGRQWHCEVCDKRASGGAAKAKLVRTECVGHPATALGEHARPTVSPPGSDWQLCVVLQVWSASSQVRKEAWRTVCRASEVSRVRTKHSFAVEWLAPQGESLSWITETVHDASVGQVAAKLPRGQFVAGLGWPSSDKR